MKKQQSFWDQLFSPEGSIFRFIIGTAALTITIQIIYDWVEYWWGLTGATILVVLLLVVLAILYWIERKQMIDASKIKPNQIPISAHKGVIVLVSPGNIEAAKLSLLHHSEKLKHCWLIHTLASRSTADELPKEIHEHLPDVFIHNSPEYLVDPEEITSTWDVVDRIFSEEVSALTDLETLDVVADVTGGTKPMTSGMALACSAADRNMQYIVTPYDEEGKRIDDAQKIPVMITTKRRNG